MTATATRERPILFSGEMVRAILDGRKTQTRRVVKPFMGSTRPECEFEYVYTDEQDDPGIQYCFRWGGGNGTYILCPYGQPDDRLWVRETWADSQCDDAGGNPIAIYRADGERPVPTKWRPSIHMPRWASRLTLEITDVRVQRLQEISEEDAVAEGFENWPAVLSAEGRPQYRFRMTWDDLNAKRGYGWDANPWVWEITFRRMD